MSVSPKELITKSARLFKNKPAVVYGEYTLSFKEANERANRLANALINLGLKSGDRVATLMRNCLQYPEIEFALVKGSFPQITLNPRLTTAEQFFQINETESCTVIVQPSSLLLKLFCSIRNSAAISSYMGVFPPQTANIWANIGQKQTYSKDGREVKNGTIKESA